MVLSVLFIGNEKKKKINIKWLKEENNFEWLMERIKRFLLMWNI